MSVVVIGDQAVGKTRMGLALAEPNKHKYVKVLEPDYETLYEQLVNPEKGDTTPSQSKGVVPRLLKLQVTLSNGSTKIIDTTWIDTFGELFNEEWQKDRPQFWKDFQTETLGQAQGIILLLNPWQEILNQRLIDEAPPIFKVGLDDVHNANKWVTTFSSWLDFLSEEQFKRVNHIVICLNKADLCWNLANINQKKAEEYFGLAKQLINNFKSKRVRINNLEPYFFLTTVKNRDLLEAPWLHLAPYIYHNN